MKRNGEKGNHNIYKYILIHLNLHKHIHTNTCEHVVLADFFALWQLLRRAAEMPDTTDLPHLHHKTTHAHTHT